MLRKLMTLVAFIAFVESKATHVQYPPTNPCVLLDIELNNTLTRDGKEPVPTFSFDGTTVTGGNCGGINKHSVILQWAKDNATVQIDFVNDTGSVSMELTFIFVPFKVWGSGSKDVVTLNSQLELGTTDKAFMCNSASSVHFNKTKDTTNALYEADWKILNIHAQAYGVQNGEFSKDAEHCAADLVTTEAPTTQKTNGTTGHTTETTEKTKPTTENGTTEHTTITTKPTTENVTTEPKNITTEPTTEPKNVTTEPMTTQPVTSPVPPPNAHPKNTFTFNNTEKGGYCARMQAEIAFKITYPSGTGTKTTEIDIPDEKKFPVKVSGDCNYTGNSLNMMTIKFRDTWSIQFVFTNSKVKSAMLGADDSNAFWWKEVTFNYTYDEKLFPDIWKNLTGNQNSVYANFTDKQFEADMDGSYMCNSDSTLKLNDDVQMETWNLQYFAFENRTDFSDDKVSQCSADAKTNSVVPIAVGAALAGLVVIVLIAYLIGRRRNRKGYESV